MDLTQITGEDVYCEPYQKMLGGHRLVHLDLKGAPPKMSYLMELLPKLKQWGATGLLVEYEDTFPYEEDLKVLRKPDECYSKSDIDDLQNVASSLGLEYIPLIQTFGHLEFVLKHDQFKHLREVTDCTMDLCPSHPDSLRLVKRMIVQMIQAHRGLKFFHIGADEVFSLCKCCKCTERMSLDEYSIADVYLSHVTSVLRFIKENFPHLDPIMWDDMLRKIDAIKMKEYNLGDLVEPMVWIYCANTCSFEQTVGRQRWDTFSQVFSNYWAASAFKGAFGGTLFNVPTGLHIMNNQLWLREIHQRVPVNLHCRGVALTGWQRYQHFSLLCELLPAGLPSLYCCLQVLFKGSFTKQIHFDISKELGFPSILPLCFKVSSKLQDINVKNIKALSFSGSLVYQLIIILSELVCVDDEEIANDADIRLQKMHEVIAESRKTMVEVYTTTTIEEWIARRLMPMVEYIEAQKHRPENTMPS